MIECKNFAVIREGTAARNLEALNEITLEDLVLEQKGTMERVIQLRPQKDIVKAAVFERHLHTGHRGLGFVGGYGLKKGAVATSVAHDSHNLIVVGTNDAVRGAMAQIPSL